MFNKHTVIKWIDVEKGSGSLIRIRESYKLLYAFFCASLSRPHARAFPCVFASVCVNEWCVCARLCVFARAVECSWMCCCYSPQLGVIFVVFVKVILIAFGIYLNLSNRTIVCRPWLFHSPFFFLPPHSDTWDPSKN